MRKTVIFNNKRFVSSLDIVNEMLKNKSEDKFTTYMDKLNQAYQKHMVKLNLRLSK